MEGFLKRDVSVILILTGIVVLTSYAIYSKRVLSKELSKDTDAIIELAIKKVADQKTTLSLSKYITPEKPWFEVYEENRFKPLLSTKVNLKNFIERLRRTFSEQAIEDPLFDELCEQALDLNNKISKFQLTTQDVHLSKKSKDKLKKWTKNLQEYNLFPNDPRWLDSMAQLATELDEVKNETERSTPIISELLENKAELELTLLKILERVKDITNTPNENWNWKQIINNPDTIFEVFEVKIHFFPDIKEFYQRYLKLKDKQFKPIILKNIEKLKKGDTYPEVKTIKERLAIEGFYRGEINEQFDDSLEEAVKAFQRLHGLFPDGVIGKKTIDSLNTPISEKLEKFKVNFERLRNSPVRKYQRVLWINVPSFRLWLIDDGQIKFTTRIIVGNRNWIYWTPKWLERIPRGRRPVAVSGPWNQTPSIEGAINYITFNPRWGTSDRIYEELLAEKSKEGSLRFDKDNYIWEIKPSGKVYLYQDPSRANLLGKVKFSFPNPYDIFLHDTPSKYLFDRWPRDFSHGCIRVENPLELAKIILELDNNSALKNWTKLIAPSIYPKTVNLNKPLPIVIDYITIAPNDWEKIAFLEDLYTLDPPKSLELENEREKFYTYLNRLERLQSGTVWPRRD